MALRRDPVAMNREGRALVAFAVLGAIVVAPIAATAGHTSEDVRVATARETSTQSQPTGGLPGHRTHRERADRTGGVGTRRSRFPTRQGPTPRVSVCGVSVPRYPGARPSGGTGDERTILHGLNRLGLTDPLRRFRTFSIPADAWVGNRRTPEDVFQFYMRRMREVPVFRMGQVLRSLLGLRRFGEVDSPPSSTWATLRRL